MELIDVINSSLIIFFSVISITAVFSYISYKVKDRFKEKISRNNIIQTESTPIQGVYPRMFLVSNTYRMENEVEEKKRLNIFSYYSLNLNEKLHKLTPLSK